MFDSKKLGLLFVSALMLSGCTSTKQAKFGGTADSQMIAVVGDRPMPATVGEPGGQVSASVVEPEPRRSPVARISGRVLDDQGQPVSDATVRLADGGVKGGRDIQSQTDASGAFTLGGLRQGSTYTLIAESDDGQERKVGRTVAKTSETGVEINLMAKDDGSTKTHSPAKPGRVKSISSREEEASSADDRSGINREDVSGPGEDPGPTVPGQPRLAPPESVGWRNKNDATARPPRNQEGDEAVATTASERRVGRAKPKTQPVEVDDEEENPLPLAKERDPADSTAAQPKSVKVSARSKAIGDDPQKVAVAHKPRRPASAPAALPSPGADDLSIAAVSPADPHPEFIAGPAPTHSMEIIGPTQPIAGQGVSQTPPAMTEAPPPAVAINSELVPTFPAPQPVFASPEPAKTPDPNAPYNPFALIAATEPEPAPATARAVTPEPSSRNVEPEPVPAPEAPSEPDPTPSSVPRKTWGDLSAQQTKPPAIKQTKATAFLARFKPTGTADAKKEVTIPAVLFDAKAHRLADFTLPDLMGKPVRFQDFDADYILLDFWGTQYKTCLDSIPHLVELQKKYGPNRLKVVGIACEKGLSNAHKTQVDDFARKLGINYAVLLSNMNTTCPVRQALDVRYFPTMILLDRQGQIVWSGEGSTPLTLTKLDLVLAKNLKATTARR